MDKVYLENCIRVGTTDVMKWCDEHPNRKLDHTFFVSEHGKNGLIVSDADENNFVSTLELHPYGTWFTGHGCDGWERLSFEYGAWLCHKNDRLIFITD